jgi:hypothetical protein
LKKLGKLFIRFLAVINAAEGIIHLIVAAIGLWGIIAIGTWDWRLLSPVIENFVFGVLSIATGIVLGKGILHGHHHH